MSSVPVIDLSLFKSGENEQFLQDLRYAAHNIGFFIS